ncbi:MAG: ATP synthase F1 subunit gamma [Bacillota bacterium]
MPGVRDIRRRIRSIQSTQQITKAMKMVAAAKLRKAQSKVVAARPYSVKLEDVLGRLVASQEITEHPLLSNREIKRVGYVVITGDRGLCGGYNANIIRLTEQQLRISERETALVAVGRKGRDYFRRRGVLIQEEYTDLGDDLNYVQARELARRLMDMFERGIFDEINLVYTRFISAIQQRPLIKRLLPVLPPQNEGEKAKKVEIEYIYEPTPQGVLDTLLPRYVETQVYHALMEAKASEQGARMTAMGSATDNASDIIDRLTLFYNRARQAAITKEISEIVGGAEALK